MTNNEKKKNKQLNLGIKEPIKLSKDDLTKENSSNKKKNKKNCC